MASMISRSSVEPYIGTGLKSCEQKCCRPLCDECERCVNKEPFHCHPVRALRIYRCTEQNGPRQKKRKEKEKEKTKMNTNMMELNMNEMELVNGGIEW